MDEAILRAIHGLPIPVVVSEVLGFPFLWVVVGIVLLCGPYRRWGWILLMTILVVWALIDGLLKPLFERPRPEIIGDHREAHGFSFPSGHAGVGFAAAVVLAKAFPRQCALFFLLAICISLSRLHLGVHYPSDVIAGAFVGLATGWMILRAAGAAGSAVLIEPVLRI
jgi:undecaprenyl-diphosphatase